MKQKLLLATLLTAFSMGVQAQTAPSSYCSMAVEGRTWKTQVGWIMENLFENRIDGDTLINGVTWKKVYNSIWGPGQKDDYYLAIRDIDKKVYAIARGCSRPRLLYDFSLEVGSMVRCGLEGNVFGCLLEKDETPDTLLGFPFVSYLRVESIDTITSHGKEYRRFTLSLLDSFRERFFADSEVLLDHVIWIEGVGSAAGPFSPWMPRPAKETIFLGCEDGKQKALIGYSDFYKDYNAVDISSATLQNGGHSSGYDLQGRQLPDSEWSSGRMPKAIYIRDGRKVIR